MKTYLGHRRGHAVDVTVNGHALNPRFDLWNHSPTGFEWGYIGSGPAQLALAILADHLGSDEEALTHYQSFKFAVVARLHHAGWELTSWQIKQALRLTREQQHEQGGLPC